MHKTTERKVPVIEFQNYSFQYRSQAEPTLYDIDLNIYAGEKVLIAGASGSGKSTLIQAINGLIPHFFSGTVTGSLKVMGKPVNELGIHEISRMVGTVLQDPDGQFIGLTVAEDIAFQMENEAVPLAEMKERVLQAARTVEMEAYLDASPHDLSGGQKQRVTMAGVLTHSPDILLFDEPLASLDPRTGKQAVELIDRIARETGKTIVIVEHRLEDVLHRPVDRTILLHEGRIVADMPPDELLSSNLLSTYGIREPLYISALKHAGVHVTPEMRPASLDSIPLHAIQKPLNTWFQTQEPPSQNRTGPALLELEEVSFGYEADQPVVKDVSFTIHRGEMVSLVGKNGAGKSTLTRLICGYIRPQQGTMHLKGQSMQDLSIKERAYTVGYVSQHPNQMISKPMIMEEVGLGLKWRGIPEKEIEERVHEALRVCGLYPYRNWPVSALSFGQKKRVTIASVLVMEPELLILDEPTAGQDYRHYTELMSFLERLNRERGLTMLMITHDMHLMLEYTDRALVMSDGRLIADAHPSDILSDQTIVEAAHLKETSLYTLAQKVQLPDPRGFVHRFIEVERRERNADVVVSARIHAH